MGCVLGAEHHKGTLGKTNEFIQVNITEFDKQLVQIESQIKQIDRQLRQNPSVQAKKTLIQRLAKANMIKETANQTRREYIKEGTNHIQKQIKLKLFDLMKQMNQINSGLQEELRNFETQAVKYRKNKILHEQMDQMLDDVFHNSKQEDQFQQYVKKLDAQYP